MSLKNQIFLKFSSSLLREAEACCQNPSEAQQKVFDHLIKCGRQTYFGREHNFENISSYEDFCRKIPITDYDGLEHFIQREMRGEEGVLWNEKASFFAKEMDSKGRVRHLPVTPHSLSNGFFKGIRMLMALYISQFPESKIFSGRTLAFGGSLEADERTHIFTGDISAIIIKNAPWMSEFFRTPGRQVALMPEGISKEDRICREGSDRNVTAIAGTPEGSLHMMDKVLEFSNKARIAEVWSNLELFICNGCPEPWLSRLNSLIDAEKTLIYSTYTTPAGIFAVQDSPADSAMRLCLSSGIFFEFIPVEDLAKARTDKGYIPHTVADVQQGVKYAVAVTTSAGLWRYLLDDIVELTSAEPLKIRIAGKIEDVPEETTQTKPAPENIMPETAAPAQEQPAPQEQEEIEAQGQTVTESSEAEISEATESAIAATTPEEPAQETPAQGEQGADIPVQDTPAPKKKRSRKPKKAQAGEPQQPQRRYTYVNLFGEVEMEPTAAEMPKAARKETGEESAGLFETADAIAESLTGTDIIHPETEEITVLFDTASEQEDQQTAEQKHTPARGDFIGELF